MRLIFLSYLHKSFSFFLSSYPPFINQPFTFSTQRHNEEISPHLPYSFNSMTYVYYKQLFQFFNSMTDNTKKDYDTNLIECTTLREVTKDIKIQRLRYPRFFLHKREEGAEYL